MPCEAKASPSSVVSATIHPRAMDQRGYEKIRRTILISKHENSGTGDC